MKFIALIFSGCLFYSCTFSQDQQESKKMDFEKYDPISTLVVPEHIISRSKFPFIDVHNHQRDLGTKDLSLLTRDMDNLNMKVMVILSGGSGDNLKSSSEKVKA